MCDQGAWNCQCKSTQMFTISILQVRVLGYDSDSDDDYDDDMMI